LLGCWVAAGCSKSTAPPQEQALPAVVPVQQPAVEPLELARQGLAALEQKQYDEAVAKLTEAASVNPAIAPFLRLHAVEAELARGNAKNAAAAAVEIVALSDTTAATVARLRLPAIHAQLGDPAATTRANSFIAFNFSMAILRRLHPDCADG